MCQAGRVASGKARRFSGLRWTVGMIVGIFFGLFLLGYVVVLDFNLVVHTYERSESSTLPALVIAAVAAFGTVLVFAWYRSAFDRLGATARRVFGWAGIAWSAFLVVGFFWTHPRHRADELATPLQAAVVTYCMIVIVVAVCLLPVAIIRLARPSKHDPSDRVRVWEVRNEEPYFVAYCDCGWVGTTYDATDPHAQDHAFRDAHKHGTNVNSEVERPLG
jgi:hypothetical protein